MEGMAVDGGATFERCDGVFLVVDDEPLVARVFAKWITTRGWRVEVRENHSDGLRALSPQLAGAVFDLYLPDGSGFALASRARTLYPSLPILVVTGRGSPATTNEAQALGVEFACKPDLRQNFDAFLNRCAATAASCRTRLVAALAKQHGLTRAEEHLVDLAIESSAHDYLVGALSVTANTVKTQIRSILAKTGAGSLERLVLPIRVGVLRANGLVLPGH
jgi:DNA-binding NarL/FixJ family response regulator